MGKLDKRLWGVLGKQQTYFSPQKQVEGKSKTPLNANAFDSWDSKRSRFKRVDGYENAVQQGGVVPQGTTPTPSPTIQPTPSITPTNTPTITPTITPSITPTTSPIPADCKWDTIDELWNANTNLWNDCQNVPVPSPTPSITPTNTITPTITNTPTPSITPTITSTITPTPSITPSSTPAPFSPNQISNLQYWFDAVSGSSVSSWTNYGLLGGSITQANATFQPEKKTNTVFGSWTGTTMKFVNRDNFAGTFTNVNFSASTLFSVFRQVTRNSSGDIIGYRIWDGSANVFQQWLSKQSSPNGTGFNLPFSGVSYGTTDLLTPTLLSIETSGLTQGTAFIDMEINDATQVMTYSASTAYLSGNTLAIGGNSGFNGTNDVEFAEFIVYNKVLNPTEFLQVEDYLKTKYQYSSW